MNEDEIKPRGLCGLSNIGNTCYMNSALQSLSNCPPLAQYFMKSDEFLDFSKTDGKPLVSKCFKELLVQMWNKKRPKCITPNILLRAIRIHNPAFRGNYQQDTQEFLRCLMDRLHEELKVPVVEIIKEQTGSSDEDISPRNGKGLLGGNASADDSSNEMEISDTDGDVKAPLKKKRSRKRTLSTKSTPESKAKNKKEEKAEVKKKEVTYRSIITNIFDGKLLSSVQCLTCNRISNRVETFQDLSLPIPTFEDLKKIHTQAIISCSPNIYDDSNLINYMWTWVKSWFIGPNIKLEDCLAAFFTHDELKGDNMYSCEKCKKLRNGIKYSRVHHLPEVLCIHLKRFRHELYFSSKINTYISFPLCNLDMHNFLSKESIKTKQPSQYDLSAIICHFGSVGGGHYISYAKNCITNKWYEFNDAFVGEVNESVVVNAEAYVLFYSLRDNRAEESRKDILNEINESPVDPLGIRYISKEWFTRYNACVKPGPVSNYELLCQHGAIDSQDFERVKDRVIPVPASAAHTLIKRFGGGPDISSLDECMHCKELARRQDYELDTFNKLHERFQEEQDEVAVSYRISVRWFNTWRAFANAETKEIPGEIDNSDIMPDENQGNKGDTYGQISGETWAFFHTRYGGGPVFRKENKIPEDSETEEMVVDG
ncbi:ubiquitin carboxyl-terminal hydrolase 20-like [Clytia hemisphaerica]